MHYKDENMDIIVSAEDFLGKNDLPYWVLDGYKHLPETSFEFSGNKSTHIIGDESETIKFEMDGKMIKPVVKGDEQINYGIEDDGRYFGALFYEDGNIVWLFDYASGTQIKVIFKKVTQ